MIEPAALGLNPAQAVGIQRRHQNSFV